MHLMHLAKAQLADGDPAAAARLDWHLSGVLAERGDTAGALAHLTRFRALRPSGAAPYERYADLLRRAGRPPADAVARLADQDPANPAIRWVLAAELGRADPAAAERVFERFYRADKSRSRASGGTGLGLPIAAAIIGRHGGTVRHAPTEGGGATFRVELPAAPHRDDVELSLGDGPAKGYASHGESWALALALRLAGFELLRAEGSEPVLVLDDVFAELDARRRAGEVGAVFVGLVVW